ncbi:MAG: ATP cone domain-containing protein [Chloroflexota bacterium]
MPEQTLATKSNEGSQLTLTMPTSITDLAPQKTAHNGSGNGLTRPENGEKPAHSSNGASRTIQKTLEVSLNGYLNDNAEIYIPTTIIKRDGRVVLFDPERIEHALRRCYNSIESEPSTPIDELTQRAINIVAAKYNQPAVEQVQDVVEMVLLAAGEYDAAKHYILYRAERAKLREENPIPDEVRGAFAYANQYFPTQLQKFQFYDKYARFDYDHMRRETWVETVDRAVDFLRELSQSKLTDELYDRLHDAILNMKAMPSMRLLAMAGPAARRNNMTIYNCSYLPADSKEAFVEALIISMSGCGVGFSVERQYIEQFPRIVRQRGDEPELFVVPDSAEGWAESLQLGLNAWFDGRDIQFDYSFIRPAGAPLLTKGGRASGPEPLRKMLNFTRERILARQGSFLRSVDAHDIMCAVGNAAVSGGVRRCLPGGTRVHTQRGSIPIEEVVVGDQVMTAVGYKPVTGWLDQGVQGIVELVTESGTIFRCTPDHRIAILSDVWGGYTFKQAQDITSEDRILFITHPIDGTQTELMPLPAKREADHSGSFVQQPLLDEQTAWFMGKFFADGYVGLSDFDNRGKGGNTTFSVACHQHETQQIDRVSTWMSAHNLNINEHSGKQEQCVKLRSSNRQIARWMHQYKQPNTSIIIPEEIWCGTKEIRAAFIAGVMDGDGTYSDRPVTVVSTVYESFARDMVKLLATLGIIAEVRIRRPANEKGWKAIWVVSIKDAHARLNAQEMLGNYSCEEWISRSGKQSGYTVPGVFVKRDVPRQDWVKKWPASTSPNMNSATLTSIVETMHYVPVQVVEIRDGGHAHTYDLEVKDGSTFVAEGYLVHNTAMISLFDFDDVEMRQAKTATNMMGNEQRWNANNSAVWPDRPLSQAEIARYLLDMVESGTGEPGIFSRRAAFNTMPERREKDMFGTNPCGEILLKNHEFCNLTIAVARPDDTYETLKEKVELATILGTIQSMATYFPGLRPQWRQNCEQERLLGVDINGQMDSPLARDPEVQERLKQVAVDTNRELAEVLGINPSASITCVKPSGNSSQLLDCSPGLHTRWAPYYIRNVRVGTHTPVFKEQQEAGVPMDPENGQTPENANTWVVHFPVKAPVGAITRNDRTAIEQCEYWLQCKTHWTEHNPSITVTYNPDEVLDIISWVWENQDKIGGMTFLPAFDANYDQMPYEEITQDEYERLSPLFPEIDFSKLYRYEREDYTTAAQELACFAGSCEVS